MRKIHHISITENADDYQLNIDWGKKAITKNKDKAKRIGTKLNKVYNMQLRAYNYLYGQSFVIYRNYWLFLNHSDNRIIKSTFQIIGEELDHALAYQDCIYNTPADLSRVFHDLKQVLTHLSDCAELRKDYPVKHAILILITQLHDESKRIYTPPTENVKRKAYRKAANS